MLKGSLHSLGKNSPDSRGVRFCSRSSCGTPLGVERSISMSWWIGSGLLFLVSLLYLRRRILRMLFPKDYAYAASREFGPELRLPAPERIRRKLPQASLDALDAWLIDFSLVDAEVWRIARLGGATVLGSSEVESRLR